MIDQLVLEKARILNVIEESTDIKTFVLKPDKPIHFRPGQFVMVSRLGVGESPFAISSDPSQSTEFEVSVQKMGRNTTAVHEFSVGDEVWFRGPYGNGFPIEQWQGRQKIIVAGGIGLAPLRSVLFSLLNEPEDNNDNILLYGIRSYDKAIYKNDLHMLKNKMKVQIISEQPQDGIDNRTGFVTALIEDLRINPENCVVLVCGPPPMVSASICAIQRKGIQSKQIYVSLEMKMKCGAGICGRCNIDHRYICKDGPVFRADQIM